MGSGSGAGVALSSASMISSSFCISSSVSGSKALIISSSDTTGSGSVYSSIVGETKASNGSSITVGFAPHDCQFNDAGTNLSNFWVEVKYIDEGSLFTSSVVGSQPLSSNSSD